ncbi:MAG: hypothetical protein V1489_02245 [Candidatus Liptonbacteria bacterium]
MSKKINFALVGLLAVVAVFSLTKIARAADCAPPAGGDYTISSDCAFANTVDGVDNGNLIINGGKTLTINAGQTIVFNSGKSITITNGTIAMNSTAQIRKTNLWVTDADADGWPASLSGVAQDDAPANGRRRYLMLSNVTADCNDNGYSLANSCYSGTGGDGALVVNGWEYADNVRTPVSSNAVAGATTVYITSTAGFNAGDEVLLIQMTGTGAGNYETMTIFGVGANYLSFATGISKSYTAGGGSLAQAIRVPNYTTVTVNSGGYLSVHNWDGSTGGVMFFRANATTTINSGGFVTVAARGFRGGTGGATSTGVSGNSGGTGGTKATAGTPGSCDTILVVAGNGTGVGSEGNGGVWYKCKGGAGGGGKANVGGITSSTGAIGEGSGGGASNGGGGTNNSPSTLESVLMGGAGGGGNSGYSGQGGGGGGGGGGGAAGANAENGVNGSNGGSGGSGGRGGVGGAGGGILIIKTVALINNGTITANASSGVNGSKGTNGSAGGAGGNGGYGGGAGGGGGGGGDGADGGGGGKGGGGGAAGSIILSAGTLYLNGTTSALGQAGGSGGALSSGSSGGSGGFAGDCYNTPDCQGSNGSRGTNGANGSAGATGTSGGGGLIRLEYNALTGTSNPAPSATSTPQ